MAPETWSDKVDELLAKGYSKSQVKFHLMNKYGLPPQSVERLMESREESLAPAFPENRKSSSLPIIVGVLLFIATFAVAFYLISRLG